MTITTGGTFTIEEFEPLIVPSSGTYELEGIHGRGAIVIDGDGTHHLRLDYNL